MTRSTRSCFNDTLLAIDEFHHVSADENSRLGALLRSVMRNTNAHIVAMTGSYFRGDALPVLMPEDEEKFTKITYNYYEQLNGYTYLQEPRYRLPLLPGPRTPTLSTRCSTPTRRRSCTFRTLRRASH